MAGAWLVLAGVLAAAGLLALWWSHRTRQATGLPVAEVVHADTGTWRRCGQPLYSSRYGLTGRPDYLVKEGRRLIPVEVKPTRDAPDPYPGDIMQLAAYCLLVEEEAPRPPPYGYLRYSRQTYRFAFTAASKHCLLQQLADMRADWVAMDVLPNHSDARRCARCGHRNACQRRMA